MYLRLRREGSAVNRKRVHRMCCEAGLAVRRRKRIGPFERKKMPKPLTANLSWSMDFVSDGQADGPRLCCLTIVHDCTRECVAIEVDTSITGTRVKAVLDQVAETRGLPNSITLDHAPEFEGKVLDAWAYQRLVQPSFIRQGKPNENAYMESFKAKFRDECLNEHRLATMAQARRIIETCGSSTTLSGPQNSLDDLTPEEFAGNNCLGAEKTPSLTENAGLGQG